MTIAALLFVLIQSATPPDALLSRLEGRWQGAGTVLECRRPSS